MVGTRRRVIGDRGGDRAPGERARGPVAGARRRQRGRPVTTSSTGARSPRPAHHRQGGGGRAAQHRRQHDRQGHPGLRRRAADRRRPRLRGERRSRSRHRVLAGRAPRPPTRPPSWRSSRRCSPATRSTAWASQSPAPDAFVDIANQYVDAGIPVFTQNTDVPNSKRFAFFALNERDAGRGQRPGDRRARARPRACPSAASAWARAARRSSGRRTAWAASRRASRRPSLTPTSGWTRSPVCPTGDGYTDPEVIATVGPIPAGQRRRQPVLPHRPGRVRAWASSSVTTTWPARSGRPAST